MAVLFFSGGNRGEENRIKQIMNDLDQEIEVYSSLNTLSKRFHKPSVNLNLMIFLVSCHEILSGLLAIRKQMYDLPVVLILPDSKKETISTGHKFYPRFISFIGGDYSELVQFLDKIINREKS